MVEQAFAQADANKDGKISASEFANWVCNALFIAKTVGASNCCMSFINVVS
jgi:hypothetical protein